MPVCLAQPSSVGPSLSRCFIAALAVATAFLMATPAAHAGDSLASPAQVRVGGQVIEQWSIKPADFRGTVIFENGSRADLEGWRAVFQALQPQAAAAGWALFAYNRPGIGQSEPTERPRDGRHIVTDLRGLLQQQGLKPPYVLVGHSLGGLYMQLFARQHPDEVKGLVLVDALYPGVIKKPQDFPFYTRWAKSLFLNAMAAREIDAIHATGEAVLALPWDARIPVMRLVNVPKSAGAIGVDMGLINSDPATIAKVRSLYPGAKTVVLDSDHQIQKANPEAVVQAIQEILSTVQDASR